MSPDLNRAAARIFTKEAYAQAVLADTAVRVALDCPSPCDCSVHFPLHTAIQGLRTARQEIETATDN